MTNRINALTVVLEHDIRVDDVDAIVQAIYQLRGVADVTPQVADMNSHVATVRAKQEIAREIMNTIRKFNYGGS